MALITRRFHSPVSTLRELDRLVDAVFAPATIDSRIPNTISGLPLAVYEDEDNYHIHAIVPGAAPEQVEVTALGDVVTIAGEVRHEPPAGAKVLWQEVPAYRFRRSVQLRKSFDIDQADATYEQGVIRLRIPKTADAKPRTIKVTSNS